MLNILFWLIPVIVLIFIWLAFCFWAVLFSGALTALAPNKE